MTDFPERISISPTYNQKRDDDFYLVDRAAFPGKGTEYVRADTHLAALKAEREKALREVLSKISFWTDQKHIAEDMKHGDLPNRTTQAYAIERIILALIDQPEGGE